MYHKLGSRGYRKEELRLGSVSDHSHFKKVSETFKTEDTSGQRALASLKYFKELAANIAAWL